MNRENGFRFLCAGLVVLALSPMAHAAIWYVDVDNSAGPWDGTSWATAYTSIQPAVDAAFADSGGEVWVAEGDYGEARTSIVHPAPTT